MRASSCTALTRRASHTAPALAHSPTHAPLPYRFRRAPLVAVCAAPPGGDSPFRFRFAPVPGRVTDAVMQGHRAGKRVAAYLASRLTDDSVPPRVRDRARETVGAFVIEELQRVREFESGLRDALTKDEPEPEAEPEEDEGADEGVQQSQ